MVQHFANFASVKFKVSMRESDESDACNENQEIRIVTLTLRFKRIITKLVAIRFVVHVVFFFESMSMRIRCENVVVTNVKKGLTEAIQDRCGDDRCCQARNVRFDSLLVL